MDCQIGAVFADKECHAKAQRSQKQTISMKTSGSIFSSLKILSVLGGFA